jgi:hypothetical protein
MFAVGATAYLYQRLQPRIVQAATQPVATFAATGVSGWSANRQLPAEATVTILVGSYPTGVPASEAQIRSITDWLDRAGFHAYYADVDLGALGRWRRVFAGAYTNAGSAIRDVERLKAAAPGLDLRAIDAHEATRVASGPSQGVSDSSPRSETEP